VFANRLPSLLAWNSQAALWPYLLDASVEFNGLLAATVSNSGSNYVYLVRVGRTGWH
jgi:hypothetical protein